MIDIYSKGIYPANTLSNLTKHPFIIDHVECGSMEGFLQSLKYRNPQKQIIICKLYGKAAKKAGQHKYFWRIFGIVWWKGQAFNLYSDELQRLIDQAYIELFLQNADYQKAIEAIGQSKLIHSIGKTDMRRTILTEYHFIRRIEMLLRRAL